jgi:transketolase
MKFQRNGNQLFLKAGLPLKKISRVLRRDILELSFETGTGHIGSCFSAIDLLTALYFDFLRVNPEEPENPQRDRFIMSKGHASAALYCCLAKRGFISRERLSGFAVNGGTLRHHPDREIGIGIEASTGSLGHGLPLAAGIALGAQLDGQDFRTVALLSDGEINEGSTWESVMFAGHHGLERLVAVIDVNGLQALGNTAEILSYANMAGAWRGMGWNVFEIDGHDMNLIQATLAGIPQLNGKPTVIIASTVKGRGVSFMENDLLWHYRCPDPNEYDLAMKELGES